MQELLQKLAELEPGQPWLCLESADALLVSNMLIGSVLRRGWFFSYRRSFGGQEFSVAVEVPGGQYTRVFVGCDSELSVAILSAYIAALEFAQVCR